MPRFRKQNRKANAPASPQQPWQAHHHAKYSEILSFVGAGDRQEIISEIKGSNHAALAELIVQTVNRQQQIQSTIGELTATLELCLACNGKLSWEAEQEADVVCRQVRQKGYIASQAALPEHQSLSRREVEILTWTARGKTRKDISKLLSISEETVKEYFDKILRKLNAVNKTHAVSIAVALGSITLYLEDIRSVPDDGAPQTGADDDKKSTRTEG